MLSIGVTYVKPSIVEGALAAMRGETMLSSVLSVSVPWLVVRTLPRREIAAKSSLERDGFSVYVPQQKVLVLPPRNKLSRRQRGMYFSLGKWESRPWLPGYCFVQSGTGDISLRDLHSLTGVIGAVFFGEDLALMSPKAIEQIRKRETEQTLDVHSFSTPFNFKVGEEVRIADGPMTAHSAKVARIEDNQEIVHLFVNLFGAERKTKVHVSQIEKL